MYLNWKIVLCISVIILPSQHCKLKFSFSERPYVKRQLSRDDIGNQGRVLMNGFIYERLQQEHVENVPAVEELQEPGTPSGLTVNEYL